MYISLFDIDFNHITNLSHVTGMLITKVYDFDEIKLSGNDTMGVNINDLNRAKLFRLNEDDGKEIYSGFVYKAKKKHNTVEIIGNDFRTIFDTNVVLIFSNLSSWSVEAVFTILKSFPLQIVDNAYIKIPLSIYVPKDSTVTDNIFGNPSKQLMNVNYYKYVLSYMKYYEYMLRSNLNWGQNSIDYYFIKSQNTHKIKLQDFEHDLSQNQPSINKTVAIMKFAEFGYKWVKQEITQIWQDVYPEQTQWSPTKPSADEGFRWVKTGNIEMPSYEWKLQEWVDTWQNVIPEVIVWSQTEPEDELQENERWFNTGEMLDQIGATKYYYLTSDNQIIEGNQFGEYQQEVLTSTDEEIASWYVSDTIKNRTYLDNGILKLEQKVNQIIFDGSENWRIYSSQINTTTFGLFGNNPSDMINIDYKSINDLSKYKSNLFENSIS